MKWGAGIFLALVALGALLGGLDGEESADDEDSDRASEQRLEPPAERPEPAGSGDERSDAAPTGAPGRNRTLVTDVVDGDTVDTDELGRVRLIGVDTPERGSCYDDAATRFTRTRIGGRVVRYELGAERTDPYGRTLAYLYLGGEMHNQALLREGYAEVLTIAPNDRYESRFEQAERGARAAGSGRWGACGEPAPDPPPAASKPGQAEEDRGGGALPPPPPDLDCADVEGPVAVGSSDPHNLDADGDGTGCE